MAALIEQIRR